MAGICATAEPDAEVVELADGYSVPLKSIRKVIAKAAKAKLHLFRPFHDITLDDLVQHGLLELQQASGFNAASGKWSTWVYTLVSRRFLNLSRDRARSGVREGKYAIGRHYATTSGSSDDGGASRRVPVVYADEVIDPDEPGPETFEGEIVASSRDDGMTLVEWCAMVRRLARSSYGDRRVRINFREHRTDRVAAIALLQARLSLSADATRWVLKQRPDLVAAIGYKAVPCRPVMEAAARMVTNARAKLREKPPCPELVADEAEGTVENSA
jgi:DNA-directed RNA polymerase specialized sigma24 family protein